MPMPDDVTFARNPDDEAPAIETAFIPPTDADDRPIPKRLRARMHDVQDPVEPVAVARTDEARLARALDHAKECVRILADNRAKDILLLDMRKVSPLVDYFVLATVASRRQSTAAGIEIDMVMKKRHEAKLGIEGSEEGRWVLLDYGDFVVHVLSQEARSYYALEEVWGDATRLDPQTGEPIADEAE